MATIHRIQPLVLAAGYGTRLQQSIVDAAALHSPLPQHRHRRHRHADAPTSLFDHIRSLPKALVPIGGRSDGRSVLLDVWLHEFQRATAAAAAAARARCHEQDAMQIEVLPVAIVVNHTMAPQFRRWASERRLNAQWLQSADLDAAADAYDGATPSASPSDVQVLLIDDGSLSNDDRLGAIGDLALSMQLLAEHYGTAWQHVGGAPHFVVVAGDTLFDFANTTVERDIDDRQRFDLTRFIELLSTLNRRASDANLLVTCYKVASDDEVRLRGIIELASDVPESGIAAWRVRSFLEKPALSQTTSRTAVPPVYGIPRGALPLIQLFMHDHQSQGCALAAYDSPGHLFRWILGPASSNAASHTAIYATKVTRRFDIGNLDQYKEALAEHGLRSIPYDLLHLVPVYRSIALGRAFARAGLAGNPSDGYYGATVSFVIPNFRAEVIVHGIEHADQRNEEALLLDTTISHQGRSHRVRVFWSDTLGGHESPAPPDVSGEPWGLGARRLVHEACRRFFALLDGTPSADAELLQYDACQATTDLQIGYNSDIPVQVGLAGSSAIVVATLRALATFTARPATGGWALLQQLVPLEQQPSLALEIERTALNIVAGLQDRVIQCYEGVVFMDFDKDLMLEHGCGRYERLDGSALPTFYLAYVGAGGLRSGRVHSNLRERFESGDSDVLAAMRRFAEYARCVRSLLLRPAASQELSPRERTILADAMDGNFDLRRQILGDAVIGSDCLLMIEIGRSHGLACKFTGSGGAILCLPREPATFDAAKTADDFRQHGFSFTVVERHATWSYSTATRTASTPSS